MPGLRGGAKAALHLKGLRLLALAGFRREEAGLLCLWAGPWAFGAGLSAALSLRKRLF